MKYTQAIFASVLFSLKAAEEIRTVHIQGLLTYSIYTRVAIHQARHYSVFLLLNSREQTVEIDELNRVKKYRYLKAFCIALAHTKRDQHNM